MRRIEIGNKPMKLAISSAMRMIFLVRGEVTQQPSSLLPAYSLLSERPLGTNLAIPLFNRSLGLATGSMSAVAIFAAVT